jgi:hypothetical protein
MMKKFLSILFALTLIFGFTSVAGALTFTLDTYDVDLNNDAFGLELVYKKIVQDGAEVDLDPGEFAEGPGFMIGTKEGAVHSDNEGPKKIAVEFKFSSPDASGALKGLATGWWAWDPKDDYATIEWSGPVMVKFDSGAGEGIFTIALSDVKFPVPGKGTVDARLTYSSVPEPGIMLLFGSGLIGLAGLRRKFRS